MKKSVQHRHFLTVEDGAFIHKINYIIFLGDSKSRRASKLHYWFKSYGDFAECMDFAYSWSFSCGGQLHNYQSEIYDTLVVRSVNEAKNGGVFLMSSPLCNFIGFSEYVKLLGVQGILGMQQLVSALC